MKKTCSIDGCTTEARCKELCALHYDRQRNRTPGRREYERRRNLKRRGTPERLAYERKRRSNPDRITYTRQKQREWLASPEGRAQREEHLRQYNQRRQEALTVATPAWADTNAIEHIYQECPKGMTVDHIVPLLGTNVCGLHVEYNLQYLTPEENSKKGNRLREEDLRPIKAIA